jgi:hypothetical protein
MLAVIIKNANLSHRLTWFIDYKSRDKKNYDKKTTSPLGTMIVNRITMGMLKVVFNPLKELNLKWECKSNTF